MLPQVIEHATTHPRFKYFREAGEDPYQSFLGVPLVDRGLLQGVLVVQTLAPRAFGPDAVRNLEAAGQQLAPIVSEARTLGLFVAPSHQRLCALAQNLWWSWDDETTALFRELDPLLWRQLAHNPVALLQRIDIDDLQERANQLVLHSRINYAYRRMQEYLSSTRTWGSQHAGVLWARPVAYFSAEFGLHESVPIYSGGLGILAGDHIKGASDLGVPLVGIGLYYHQAYFKQRLDIEGYQQEDYIDVDRRLLPMQPATDRVGSPGGRDHRHAIGLHRGTRVEAGRGAQHAAAARLRRRGQPSRGPSADGAAVRRRRLDAHSPGTAPRRRRRARAEGAGHLAVGGPSQRRPQRLCRARTGPRPHGDRRHRSRGGHPPRRAADRLHNAHARSGRPRSVHAGADRGTPRPAARRAGPFARRAAGAGTREPGQSRRDVLHDRAGVEAVAPRQRGLVAARSGLARHVDRPVPGRGRGTRADRSHHQRRARADLAGAADAPDLRPAPGHRLARPLRRAAVLGRHREHRRRRAVGDTSSPEGAADRFRAPKDGERGRASRRARRHRRATTRVR